MGHKRVVPSGWELVRLGEIASIEIGGTPARNEPQYWDSEKRTTNRWVSIRDIQARFLDDTAERISDEGAKNSNAKLFSAGTLLMSFKLSIGRVTIPRNPVYTNEAIAAVIADGRAERDFMFYALPRAALAEASDVAIKGSTLNKSKLKALRLLLPPITEQRGIASILGSIDTAIERTRAVIDQVRVVKQALLADLMTNGLPGRHKKFKTVERIGRIPQRWSSARLDAIAQVVRGSSPRPAGDARFFNGDHVPWITVKSVTIDDGMYLTETETRLTKEGAERSRYLEKGTLVLTNSGATLGVPKILGISGCANDGIAAFLNLDESTNTVFLYHFLSTMTLRFREVIAPGLGQPNLNTDLIGATVVPIPSPKEQTAISEVVNSVDDRIESETLSLGQMLVVKQALSDALLTGRVRVQHAEGVATR